MKSKKINYDSIEESQKIKDSNDMESDERIETKSQKYNKPLIIIIITLFLFLALIFILFIIQMSKYKAKLNSLEFQKYNQIYQNLRNNQTGLNQQNQQNENPINSIDQDLQEILAEALNQTYNIIHKKRNHPNFSISELFPKIKKKTVNNITEILKSNTLNIKDKKITKEYIQFIKPLNETIETKYRQILFPDLNFDNYSFVHIYNYSMYLSYLNKAKKKNR